MSERRIGILIASSRFPEESKLEDLRFPENDVDGLNEILTSKDHGQFTQTFLLKNKLHHEILLKINQVLREADKNDLVLIYYSGHGKLNPAGKLHLASTDSVINALEATSIPVSTIKDYVDISSSNQIVLILDCCFSGAAGLEFTKGGVDDQLQLVSGGRGTYIMTASTGIQVAQEKESDQYGAFTKHVIEGIKSGEADLDSDGRITMGDLYRYVHDKVLDEGFQEPMKWDLNVRGEMVIARSGKTPRDERRKKIIKLLFNLAGDGVLPDEILENARKVIAIEPDQLSEDDLTYDRLLDRLLDRELLVGEFIGTWYKVKKEKEDLRHKAEEARRRKDKQEQELKAAEEKRRKEEEELKRKTDEERRKKEAEAKRKAEEERKKKEIEANRKIEEKRKRKEEEQKRIEAARKAEEERKQREAEAKREADEERRRKEEEELKRKAEEERKKKEAELKSQIKEEQKRRKVNEDIKIDKPETEEIKPLEPKPDSTAFTESKLTEPIPPKSPKTTTILKFGVWAVIAVLLIAGVWWRSSKNQADKLRLSVASAYTSVKYLEYAVAKIDKQQQIEKLDEQRDTLSLEIESYVEQAAKIGLGPEIEELQNRLNQVHIQLAKKEEEFFATQRAKIFVAAVPDNAMVKILNINQRFQQGMELEPGRYHVEVSLVGYEPQDRWIEIGVGEEKQIHFELKKIFPKIARLHVETFPEDATVRILNIKPKFSQGMEIEPGPYHVEVAAEGYETEKRWIDLVAGDEKPIRFELKKIKVAEPISPQKPITNTIGMKFVLIRAGSFTMGSQLSPEDVANRYGGIKDNDKPYESLAKQYKDEHPPHRVKISKPFYLQTTEVSQGQWKKFMSDNLMIDEDCGDDCPVRWVSWNEAQEFVRSLNQMEGTNKYRLPTEAEWEYACRAGTTTPFFSGECISTDQANYNGKFPGKSCPEGVWRGRVKVGSFQPNDWGLYDMHGNVSEWCQDGYGDYPSYSVVDPKGPDNVEGRVIRGGSAADLAGYLRSAVRSALGPGGRGTEIGFRVARDF